MSYTFNLFQKHCSAIIIYTGGVLAHRDISDYTALLQGGKLSGECRALPPEVAVETTKYTSLHFSNMSSRRYFTNSIVSEEALLYILAHTHVKIAFCCQVLIVDRWKTHVSDSENLVWG